MAESGSKATNKPAAGAATVVRREPEEERRRTKHGLVRERAPRPPGRFGGGGLPSLSMAVGRDTSRLDADQERELDAPSLEVPPEPVPVPVAAPAPPVPIAMPIATTGLLELSEPGDRLEREADEAAERVVRRLAVSPGGAPAGPPRPPEPPPAYAHGLLVQRASLVEVAAETAGLVPRLDSPGGLIVEDRTETLTPGQMKKTPFMARLREVACETADRELRRAGRTAQGCPYMEEILGRFARRSPEQLERAIRRYAPETRTATTARDYFAPLATRLGQGVANWVTTGRMPENLPDEFRLGRLSGILEVGLSLGRAARALFKGKDGRPGRGGVDAEALAGRLGPGRPLDGSARGRMESAFGHPFGDVRIHVDDRAAALSRDLEARAFTLGTHVAFGGGEYRPGTPMGDALLAHELAHVVQQRGARPAPEQPIDTASAGHERDADLAAAGAMAALYMPARSGWRRKLGRRDPSLRGGVRLSRCSDRARSVRELRAERCGYTPERAPAPANLPPQFRIDDLPRSHSNPRTIFFERGATVPDQTEAEMGLTGHGVETQKILNLVGPGGPLHEQSIRIIGVTSEDEPAELAGIRARNVDRLVRGFGHAGAREVIAAPERGRGRVDYREVRVVVIERPGQQTAVPQNVLEPCDDPSHSPTHEAVFQTARIRAGAMARTARDRLTWPLPAAAASIFRLIFGNPVNHARVVQMRTNLNALQAHIDGRMASDDGHKCATASHNYCVRGWAAGNHDVGPAAVMTLCESFFRMSSVDAQARLLVHEGSHGTPWTGPDAGTVDVAYNHHRIMRAMGHPLFIEPGEAFHNADSVALFVAAMQPGAPVPTLGPATADVWENLVPGIPVAAGRADAERAIAFVQQRIVSAHKHAGLLHTRMASVSTATAFTDTVWTMVNDIFHFVPPGANPGPAHRFRVAALVDRLEQQREVLRSGGGAVVLRRTNDATTTWHPGPGREVSLGLDFYAAPTHEAQARIMIRALARATEASLALQYDQLIDRLRVHAGNPNVP